MYDFDYVRARTLDEAARLLGHPDARLLSGGQTLIPALKQRLNRPARLVDLQDIGEMRGIEIGEREVTVGALTRHAEVAAHAGLARAIPALAFLAGGIADPQVRHQGTLGGSIANNDPAADYPAALVGLGARVLTTQRAIDADAFFTGLFSTALAPDEIVVRVIFPRALHGLAGYCKMPNPASGYVMAGCFIALTDDGARVAINGAGPCVFRQRAFEAALNARFDAAALDACIRAHPQTAQGLNADLHASAAYRAQLVNVAARRALAQALGLAPGDAPGHAPKRARRVAGDSHENAPTNSSAGSPENLRQRATESASASSPESAPERAPESTSESAPERAPDSASADSREGAPKHAPESTPADPPEHSPERAPPPR